MLLPFRVCWLSVLLVLRAARPDSGTIELLLGHLVFDSPHNGREDGTAGAATDDPSDEGAEVKIASSRPSERRDQGLEELTAKTTSDGASNRISDGAEARILDCGADTISTDDTGDNLNDEVE